MARPTSGIATNSSPRYFSTSRERRSPGLRPTIDINAPQQPNPFDDIVRALDQFEGAVTGVIRQEAAEKAADEKARQRLIQAGATETAGREIKAGVEQLLRDNPKATRADIEEFIAGKIGEVVGPDGEFNESFPDETAKLMARTRLSGLTGELLFNADEAIRVRDMGAALTAATDLFAQGAPSTEAWVTLKGTLEAAGFTGAALNKALAQTAISVAEMREDPSVIASIPDTWADGTPTFKRTAEHGDEITKALRQVERTAEAKRLEGLEMTRVEWLTNTRAAADRGRGLTKSEMAYGLQIGVAEGTLVSINDGAAAARDRAAARAEQRAAAARQEALLRQQMAGNIHSVSAADRNKMIDAEYNAAKPGRERLAVIDRYARQGYLPPTWQNYLSNSGAIRGTNAQQWARDMRWLKANHPEVYAQRVPAASRTTLAAYDGLIRAGIPEAQARSAVADRDPKRITSTFTAAERQKGAREVVRELKLEDPDSGRQVGEMFSTFLSMPGVSIDEAKQMTSDVIRESTFVSNGRMYQRSLVPSPEALDIIRREAAAEYNVEPRDIEIFEDPQGTRIGVRPRGRPGGEWLDPEVTRSWLAEKSEADARVARRQAAAAAQLTRIEQGTAEFRLQQRADLRISQGM